MRDNFSEHAQIHDGQLCYSENNSFVRTSTNSTLNVSLITLLLFGFL